jgi:hypothetical protein
MRLFRRLLPRSTARRPARRRGRFWNFEILEDRTLFSISALGIAHWVEEGPGPLTGGQLEGIPNTPVAGAVSSLAVDPANPDVVFLGTVNGGVWRTTHATSASPAWIPWTDQVLPSLSIGAVALSPLDSAGNPVTSMTDPNNLVVYAGNAGVSSAGLGSPTAGIFKSVNGGAVWAATGDYAGQGYSSDFRGLNVVSIVPTTLNSGQVVLAATSDVDPGPSLHRGGVYRSADGGQSWVRISGNGDPLGLPDAGVSDLIADPSDPNGMTFYAAVPSNTTGANAGGAGPGIYRSTDGGQSFRLLAANQGIPGPVLNGSLRIRLAANNDPSPSRHALFAGFISDGSVSGFTNGPFNTFPRGSLTGVFRFDFSSNSWTSLGLPSSTDTADPTKGPQTFGLFTGEPPQGAINFSIAADPIDPQAVYVGGDSQPAATGNQPGETNAIGCTQYDGRLFHGGFAGWVQPVCSNAAGTAPHADSRAMAFDSQGNLLEADDGGIYKLLSPNNGGWRWVSLNGNLRDTELQSVAYDPVENLILGGAQDVGTPGQQAGQSPGAPDTWTDLAVADGGVVQVDTSGSTLNPPQSVQYFSEQGLNLLQRLTYIGGVPQTPPAVVRLINAATGQDLRRQKGGAGFRPPLILNAVNPNAPNRPRSLLIGTRNTDPSNNNALYESFNQGDTLQPILQTGGPVVALAYGGMLNGQANPGVVYVSFQDAQGRDHFQLRTAAAGAFTELTAYPGGLVRDVVLDPTDWRIAYALDADGHVWMTTDATDPGLAWTDLAQNRPLPAGFNRQFATIDLAQVPDATSTIQDVLLVGGLGAVYRMVHPTDTRAVWTAYGDNLPNVLVRDLHYVPQTDTLVAGTLGRGAWTVRNASASLAQPGVLAVSDDGIPSTIELVRFPALDPVYVNITVQTTADGTVRDDQLFLLADLARIVVTGSSGSDNLVLNSGLGVIYVPGAIGFDGGTGGTGNTLTFNGRPGDVLAPALVGPPAGLRGLTVLGQALGARQPLETVYYQNVPDANVINNVGDALTIAIKDLLKLFSTGLKQLSTTSRLLDGPTLLGQPVPILGGSLGRALNGVRLGVAQPVEDRVEGADEAGPDVLDDGSSLLERFVETGTGGFSLDDLGTSITTLDGLTAALQGLDPNGTVTPSVTADTVTFDVLLHKTLDGQANVDVEDPLFSLNNGLSDIAADLTLHLRFGVDANGLFWDVGTPAAPSTLLTITNVRLLHPICLICGGTGAGESTSTAGGATASWLQTVPDQPTLADLSAIQWTVQLHQVDPDSANGSTTDGLVRLDQLSDLLPAGASTTVQQAVPVQAKVSLDVAPLQPGLQPPFSLGPDPAQLTLTWAAGASPNQFTLAAGNSEGQILLDFRNLSSSQLARGLAALAATLPGLQQLTGSAFGIPPAVVPSTLGDLLNQPPPDLVIPDTAVTAVSPVFADGGFNQFNVLLSENLTGQDVALGDSVSYTGSKGQTFQGTVDALGPGEWTVRFPVGLTQDPNPTAPGLHVSRPGGLQHDLDAALGDLIDPHKADAEAPTLQDFLNKLADLTAADPSSFQVNLTGSGSNQALDFPITLRPPPRTVTAPFDLGAVVPGLVLDQPANLVFTIAPTIRLDVGLLLAASAGTDPFFLVAGTGPTVSVRVTAAPAAPLDITGKIGFLNVQLQATGTSPGVSLAGTVTATLTDPNPGADGGRMGLAELNPPNPGTLYTTGIAADDPLVINVEGVQVTPAAGTAVLPPLQIALPGTGAGRVTTLAQLQALSSAFTVTNAAAYTGYIALTAAPVTSSAGGVFDNVVAVLAAADPAAAAADFTATIDWGDGHTSAGSLVALGNGRFDVRGSNRYASPGSFRVGVLVRDAGGGTAAAAGTATVGDALVGVHPGRVRRRGSRFFQTVTLRNSGTQPLQGPFSLVLTGLGRKAKLANRTGVTTGSPYLSLDLNLEPGATVTVVLQFVSPTSRINYGTRVLAGPG